MLSFDGKGINDQGQKYAPRIATFANDEMAQKWGKVFAATEDMLAALELAKSLIIIFGYQSVGVEKTDQCLEKILSVIAKAKGL